MAAVSGVNVTAIAANTKIDKYNVGKLHCFVEEYEASALAAGSTIDIGKLPKDSALVDAVITHDALGASSTLALGDGTTSDLYIVATSSATAGAVRLSDVDGLRQEITTETDLYITTAGASITGTIRVVISYIV